MSSKAKPIPKPSAAALQYKTSFDIYFFKYPFSVLELRMSCEFPAELIFRDLRRGRLSVTLYLMPVNVSLLISFPAVKFP